MAYNHDVYPFYFTCNDLSNQDLNKYEILETQLYMRPEQLSIDLYVDYSRVVSDDPKSFQVNGKSIEVTKSYSNLAGIVKLAESSFNQDQQFITITWKYNTTFPVDWYFSSMGLRGTYNAGTSTVLNIHDHLLLYPSRLYTLTLSGEIRERSTHGIAPLRFGQMQLATFAGYGIHTYVVKNSETGSNYTLIETEGNSSISYDVYDHSLGRNLPAECLRGSKIHCRFQFYRP